jgi:hypothetical protein
MPGGGAATGRAVRTSPSRCSSDTARSRVDNPRPARHRSRLHGTGADAAAISLRKRDRAPRDRSRPETAGASRG